MALSHELISMFAKQITKATKTTAKESTVYGTIQVDANGNKYVKLDGSDQLTPLTNNSMSATANDNERVSVMIKDHTATVTGNISSPAARTDDVTSVQQATVLLAKNIQATEAYFNKLIADEATIGKLVAAEVSIAELLAKSAEIDELLAGKITVTDLIADKIDADVVIADKAVIESLKGAAIDVMSMLADKAVVNALIADKATLTSLIADEAVVNDLVANKTNIMTLIAENADLKYATIERLEAVEGHMDLLDVNKLAAAEAELGYVKIDFSNIDKVWMGEFFAESGIIQNITVDSGIITGELVGVTIKGDWIQANTLVADKLVIKGEDGLYYKLNFESGEFTDSEEVPTDSLHGSVITAKSITAEKVSVKDLVAFGATIGGFKIGQKTIYSGLKETVENPDQGVYMDSEGQFSLGDSSNFLKYYRVDQTVETIDTISPTKTVLTVIDDTGSDLYSSSVSNGVFVLSGGSNVTVRNLDGIVHVSDYAWKLDISADNILFGVGSKTSIDNIKRVTEKIKLGIWKDPITGEEYPCIELSEGDSDFKQIITNKKTIFADGINGSTEINSDGVETENLSVNNDLRQGNFLWSQRSNGNYGLTWSIRSYTIFYNANGGSGAPYSQTKEHGTDTRLSFYIPNRSGYTFLGWSTTEIDDKVTYFKKEDIYYRLEANSDDTGYTLPENPQTYTPDIILDVDGPFGVTDNGEDWYDACDISGNFMKVVKRGIYEIEDYVLYAAGSDFSGNFNATLYAVWG